MQGKYIGFGRFEEVFEYHKAEMGLEAVSRSTLWRVWKTNWKDLISLKKGEGKRCQICAQLDEQKTHQAQRRGRRLPWKSGCT